MGCARACCEGCERWGKGEVERGAEVRGEGGGTGGGWFWYGIERE